MKRIFEYFSLLGFILILMSCGHTKATVVGQGEGGSNSSQNQLEKKEQEAAQKAVNNKRLTTPIQEQIRIKQNNVAQ